MVTPTVPPDVIESNGRLAFKSSQSFVATLTKLNLMSDREKDAWARQFNFSPLINEVDTIHQESLNYDRFPTSYKMVLNKNAEVSIGDTLI